MKLRARQRAAAHAFARSVLAECFGVPPGDVAIDKRADGVPVLLEPADCADIHISIAHSGDCVAFAHCDTPVGIDCEAVERRIPRAESWAQVLTTAEQSRLAGMREADRGLQFLTWWCLKEAWVKGLGIGIGRHMQRLECSGVSAGQCGRVAPTGAPDWGFHGVLQGGYYLAIAVQAPGVPSAHFSIGDQRGVFEMPPACEHSESD